MTIMLAVSTHWNASQHYSGEEMIGEILELGYRRVELGYDLRPDLVPGVKKMVEEGAVGVDSVHNFCPVPMGAPQGHPELFYLTSLIPRDRKSAVTHTTNTIRFASEMGARTVVVHAGRVSTRASTRELIYLCEQGKQYDDEYEKTKLNLQVQREKLVEKHLDQLYRSLDELLPVLEETGVRMALENLPSWECVPSETEMQIICEDYDTPLIRYWHDIGHGQIREHLGFISQRRWLQKLQPFLAGMHIHDVMPPTHDHLMPPAGKIDFKSFAPFARDDIALVLEPAPGTEPRLIKEAGQILADAWHEATVQGD